MQKLIIYSSLSTKSILYIINIDEFTTFDILELLLEVETVIWSWAEFADILFLLFTYQKRDLLVGEYVFLVYKRCLTISVALFQQ